MYILLSTTDRRSRTSVPLSVNLLEAFRCRCDTRAGLGYQAIILLKKRPNVVEVEYVVILGICVRRGVGRVVE
jgi:hypothetical protein